MKTQMDRRLRPVVLFSVLALAVAGACAAPAAATFPGRNGKLVVELPSSSGDNLYLVNPDGSHALRVAHGTGPDLSASFSPNGKKIVFYRSHGQGSSLIVVDADGNRQRRIPNTAPGYGLPAFAPDGRTVAYGNAGIFTIRLDGTHRGTVDSDPATRRAVYAPDGVRVAFTRHDLASGIEQPYIIRTDGTHLHRVAKSGTALSFAPDGRRLLLSRDGDLYVLRFADHQLRRLTQNAFDDTDAVFSPDGSRIAFARREAAAIADFSQVGVWVMHADGSHKHRVLTESTGALDWQPVPTDDDPLAR